MMLLWEMAFTRSSLVTMMNPGFWFPTARACMPAFTRVRSSSSGTGIFSLKYRQVPLLKISSMILPPFMIDYAFT